MAYTSITDKAALNRKYSVMAHSGRWVMDAPLSTIRELFQLHNRAINRIIASGHEPCPLFFSGMRFVNVDPDGVTLTRLD